MQKNELHVLLIEDNPGDARLLREVLKETENPRIHLQHATTLADGLGHLARDPFDVLLLDLSLPDSFGFETLQRATAASPETPIVVLTGTDDQTLALRAVAEGAQDYLIKGYLEPELLVRSLRYSIERKRVELVLRIEKAFSANLIASIQDAILAVDRQLRYTVWNQGMENLTGLPAESVLGRSAYDVFPEIRENGGEDILRRPLGGEDVLIKDRAYFMPDSGEQKFYEGRYSPLRGDAGTIIGTLGILRDTTERKRIEEQLAHSAFHDTLTGLPNRAGFREQIERALARHNRRPGYNFAVLFLDLDGFKHVNDSLGHQAGDRLLIGVADRIKHCLRHGDVVARLGGDEFTLLLDDIQAAEDVTRVAERILFALSQSFEVEGHEVFTGASIGVAVSATTYQQAEEMLRDADTAMYRAKHFGKGRFEIFNAEMHVRAVTRLKLETDLRRALERREFILHFQPVVSLLDGTPVAFESLVRWRHPERGMISPGEFIPVAEQSGLIVPLDKWVLEESCRWLRRLDDGGGTTHRPSPSVNVNLSARQFGQADLVDSIRTALKDAGIEASRLNLEVTESAVMEDARAAAAILAELRSLGVRVYIDDFGTGHSSLSYLSRFPIDALKIDRSFVSGMSASPEDAEIVRAVVALGRAINVEVIAEGVETDEQADRLTQLGCRLAQGYHFSRPLPGDDARAYFASHRRYRMPLLVPSGAGGTPDIKGAEQHSSGFHSISGRKEWEGFGHAVVNALQAHIAVIDAQGDIIAVNQTWKDFAEANPPAIVDSCVGANYLQVCEQAATSGCREGAEMHSGIRSVLRREQPGFTLEYPCHSPTEQRWFIARVTLLPADGSRRAVISHENITERKLAELALHELRGSVSGRPTDPARFTPSS